MTALRPMEMVPVEPAATPVAVEVEVDRGTGSASVRIPIPLTVGRDGHGPALALTFGGYDPLSPFPHGWSLSGLPSIDLDTREGLPRYDGTDRYRFAGQELVPLDDVDRPTAWVSGDFDVRVFRARIESTPARIERWVERATRRLHWRVRTGDGAVMVFGRRLDDESRITDGERTYRWLLEASVDRLGNAMLVRYRPEDAVGLDSLSHDAARFAAAIANRYPDRILYGNAVPLTAELLSVEDPSAAAAWYFEAVFDYGDHDGAGTRPTRPWPVRADVGMTARPGFEVRCRRLCRRVLMFHHFPDELGEDSTLVSALELRVDEAAEASALSGVRLIGYRTERGARVSAETPWASFVYSERAGDAAFETVAVPLLGTTTRLVDLYGEGIPGFLTTDASGAWFSPNRGGFYDAPRPVDAWPRGLSAASLEDFDGDGDPEWVQLSGSDAGYYRLDRRAAQWQPLVRFDATPSGTSVARADLTGDGRADLVVWNDAGGWLYESRGEDGFADPVELRFPPEKAPRVQLALDRFLADMTGDGLADIVEVLNGSVRYWPNLGRGEFGEPIVMDDAPRLDAQASYDAARVLLFDLDGSGTSDLLYLRGDGAVMCAPNQRGLRFGASEAIAWGAPIASGVTPQLVDVYADGSMCLSYFAPGASGDATMQVLRLARAPGPRRLVEVQHPLGSRTALTFGHSVAHYLRDVAEGRGWDTPLPSHRAVVDVLRRTEPIDGEHRSERFAYHDGHYDPRERAFAVFAIVDHLDVDPTPELDCAPAFSRTFFHTGELDYASRFAQHHYAGDMHARPPPVSGVESNGPLSVEDFEDALRALSGGIVREEVFAADLSGVAAAHPFRISASSQRARVVREAGDDYRTAVQVVPEDSLDALYEQDAEDPRETYQRVLEVDEYLVPRLSVEAGFPRRSSLVEYTEQSVTLATASSVTVVHFDETGRFELGIQVHRRSYEVHVPDVEDDYLATTFADDLATALASANAYDAPLDPNGTTVEARELVHERTYYWNDAGTAARPLESIGTVTLPHHTETSAYDRGQLTTIFGSIDPDNDLPDFGFVIDTDIFYSRGPITRFKAAAAFFRLEESEAYDTGVQRVVSDRYHLVTEAVTDEVGNTTRADIDYHVLAPWRVTDANQTTQEIDYDPLGVTRRTSRYGTALDESESLVDHGFTALARGTALPTLTDALTHPETALGSAESLLVYEYPTGGAPMRVLTLTAEELVDRGPGGTRAPARAQVDLSYLDGFGRTLQQRRLVEAGIAWTDDGGALIERSVATRWRVSGHLVYDTKQRLLSTYEPFFRDQHAYEPALSRRRLGVATVTKYDALGRAIGEHFPNGTFTEMRLRAWSTTSFDANDSSDRATQYIDERDELSTSDPERMALDQALSHAETPITQHVDALGRVIATVEVIEAAAELTERSVLDIRGLSEETIDRRPLTVSTRSYDRLGRQLFEHSADAGEIRSLFDAAGREVKRWHEHTEETRVYDVAGRLTELHVDHGPTRWLAEELTYGERRPGAADRNQLGRLVLVKDAAGQQETKRYGAFGEPLEVERTLTATPGLDPDWSGSVILESRSHTSISAFDALGRRARAWLPDGTERQEDYLRSGPLEVLRVITPDTTPRTLLARAEYNARGQQTFIVLGNGVEITNTYDDETLRLYRRHSVVPSTSTYQDLRHHYDPVGNLVYLDDRAQSPTAENVIRGLTVTAERTYRHDARYQLIEATGRVHRALTMPDFRGDAPVSGAFRGTRRLNLNDGRNVARYRRTYAYDDAGNLTEWDHGPEGPGPGSRWTNENWVSSTSNRSYSKYDLNGIAIPDAPRRFDARGQIMELPGVRAMQWSARDQLRRVVLIERGSDDDDELYDYAADGTRLRKTTRRLADGNVETTETLYLDGCELRRVRQNTTEILVRWSAHADGDEDRHATVYFWERDTYQRETRDVDVVREHYHLGTRTGSVSLELGASGEMLAYEEYFPYGRTAFLAGDSLIEIQFRTLRFVGKNQDDATGFYAFQYRYYAPFIGNWVSPDPAGEVDGPNRYMYAQNNPTSVIDPTGTQSTDVDVRRVRADPPSLPPDPSRPAAFIQGRWEYFDTPEQVQSALASATGGGTYYEGRPIQPGAVDPEAGPTSFAGSGQDMRGTGTRGASLADAIPYEPLWLGRPRQRSFEDPTLAERPAADAELPRGERSEPGPHHGDRNAQDVAQPVLEASGAAPVGGPTAGAPSAGAPPTGETLQVGILRGGGNIELRDIPVPAGDAWARRLIEDSVAERNEDQAARQAVGEALANGLTLGLSGRAQGLVRAAGEAAQQWNEGRYGDLALNVANQAFRNLTPFGWAYSAAEGVAGAAPAALEWLRLTHERSLSESTGGAIDIGRLREQRAETPEGRARQDEARGRTWSLPGQFLASSVGGAITVGALAQVRGIRAPAPADRRLSRAIRADARGPILQLQSRRSPSADPRPRFDPDRLRSIIRNLESETDAEIRFVMNEVSEQYLDNNGANGMYIPDPEGGGGTVLLRRNPARATVIEELLHLGQHRRAGFRAEWAQAHRDPAMRRAQVVLLEVAAQEHLLRLGSSMNNRVVWTLAELEALRLNQLTWVQHMRNVLGTRSGVGRRR